MQGSEDLSISPMVKTALNNFGFAVKTVLRNKIANKKQAPMEDDEFKRSDSEPLPQEVRLQAAIKKYNAANELRFVAETNYFADLDNDCNLLQEYNAYRNPEFKDLTFSPVYANTVIASHKGKPIEIKSEILDDGTKEQEINFHDGSRIKYTTFSEGGKMEINGEEYEMPAGAIVETKSINGRVFSQLIQTPDMERNLITKPEYLDVAEQALGEFQA